jgi:Flp pilus assembly pilin Flp
MWKEVAMPSKIVGILPRICRCLEREAGQALAEYGLILALIVVAAILSLTALGVAIAGEFEAIIAVLP